MFLQSVRSAGLRLWTGRYLAERTVTLFRGQYDHDSADLHVIVEIDRVLIGHADTPGRDSLSDIFGLIGAVDAIERVFVAGIKINAARAHRIVRAAGDISWQRAKPSLLAGRRHPSGPFLEPADLGDPAPGLR